MPLYRLQKKAKHFTWTVEAEEALNQLKGMVTSALVLVPP